MLPHFKDLEIKSEAMCYICIATIEQFDRFLKLVRRLESLKLFHMEFEMPDVHYGVPMEMCLPLPLRLENYTINLKKLGLQARPDGGEVDQRLFIVEILKRCCQLEQLELFGPGTHANSPSIYHKISALVSRITINK